MALGVSPRASYCKEIPELRMAGASKKARVPAQQARATAASEISAGPNGAVGGLFANLPRRSPEDLDELARAQGLPLVTDIDALGMDSWPEDESCDDFIAAYRSWRRA